MASIIKAGSIHAGSSVAQQSAYNFEDISQKASGYVDSVRQQATQIIARAQQEAAVIRAEAEKNGKQAAVAEAKRAAQQETQAKWQSLQPALQQAITEVSQLRSQWLRDWQQQLVHLAVAIAERLVRSELVRRPEISEQWIREALEMAAGSHAVSLHLNPQDLNALGTQQPNITESFGQLAETQIVPDPQVPPGNCRVTTEDGEIDQRIKAQLARIEEELTD